ncbi:MAG: hypothetical protein KC646_04255 [Candidatus Cloacimonetes bacterium]|nr:hypothetical protein [Candidatus Cloacimonadota bacterium]
MYKLASGLTKIEKYKPAHKYWKRLLQKRSNDDKIRYYYSLNLFKLEKVSMALVACSKAKSDAVKAKCKAMVNKAKDDYPDDYSFYQAELSFAKKDYERTFEILEELLSSEIDNVKYRLLLGKFYHATKEYTYAWDQYNFVEQESESDNSVKRLKAKLKEIGKKSLLYVNEHKGDISDENSFYNKFLYALKFYTNETSRRVGGFKIKYETYLKTQIDEEEESFENYYQLAFIQSALKNSSEAKETYEMALNEAPDDFLYATVEFLIKDLSSKKDGAISEEDFINMAGGEDVYNQLLKASEKANDAARSSEQKAMVGQAKQTIDNLGIDKEEFIREYENFKRKLQNARSTSEKENIKKQFKSKYGHLMDDPKMKGQLRNFLNSSEGQNLRNKYQNDLGKLKSKYGKSL